MKLEFTIALFFSLVLSFYSFPLVSGTENSWTQLEPMPTARIDFGVAVVDGKIYAFGGYNEGPLNTTEMYDPETDTWITKASMPSARYSVATAVIDDKIFVIGGNIRYDAWSSRTDVYDPLTDTWENKTSIPKAGKGFSANVVNGKIFVMGGLEMYYFPYFCLEETQVYDPKNDSWTTKAPMPNPVYDYGSAVIDDKLYFFGGRNINSIPKEQNFTQVYDPKSDTWSYGQSVPFRIHKMSCASTSGTFSPAKIRIFKGNDHLVYKPETDEWFSGVPMPTPRSNTGVGVVYGEFYLIGGNDEEYRTENEKFTPYGNIPEFPSWFILPLLLTATVAIAFCKKRLYKN